jgi:hypothetical protein
VGEAVKLGLNFTGEFSQRVLPLVITSVQRTVPLVQTAVQRSLPLIQGAVQQE